MERGALFNELSNSEALHIINSALAREAPAAPGPSSDGEGVDMVLRLTGSGVKAVGAEVLQYVARERKHERRWLLHKVAGYVGGLPHQTKSLASVTTAVDNVRKVCPELGPKHVCALINAGATTTLQVWLVLNAQGVAHKIADTDKYEQIAQALASAVAGS